ncbi:MAG: HPr family phosphocarrier protein [Lachnospiraceae bacterium]|nr:HPr family phosphocarrier protein [Lachnospiraceae bacterium]
MISHKLTIQNPTGLHLRPAGVLCQEAMKFRCRVMFKYGPDDRGEANAKSILSVLGACIRKGDDITLICDGEDEAEAMHKLVPMIMDGLGDRL